MMTQKPKDTLEQIRRRQSLLPESVPSEPQAHQPEILYIGCVDARLDPIDDIGIDKGKALIFRNIGAMVMKEDGVSMGAVLEFFLNHIPPKPGKTKHIIVSGHTDCGGLKACRQGDCPPREHYLYSYLSNIGDLRARVMEKAQAGRWTEPQILAALEQESVRKSMRNLVTYEVVRNALGAGRVQIHGWVLNTATRRILEMNPESLEFEPMTVVR